MKFKVGDVCKVTKQLYGHQFEIGSLVEILKVTASNYETQIIRASRQGVTWFLHDDELEPATPMEIAATLTTKKVDEQDDPFKQQVGGDHYKSMTIQPVEFILANGLGFCEGNAIKYLCRYRQKGGVQDLEKAKHYVDLLIEQYNKNAPIK